MKRKLNLLTITPWHQAVGLSFFLHVSLFLSAWALFYDQTPTISPPSAHPIPIMFIEGKSDQPKRLSSLSPPLALKPASQEKKQKPAKKKAGKIPPFSLAVHPSKTSQTPSQPLINPKSPLLVPAQYQGVGLNNPTPPYPRRARELGYEGCVVIQVEVNPQGHPVKINLQKSSGYLILDDSALTTIQKWHFIPAKSDNKSLWGRVTICITYSLKDQDGKIG